MALSRNAARSGSLSPRHTTSLSKPDAGTQKDGEDGLRLKIMVPIVPEDGKASEAVIKVLANAWKLAKSLMEISSGVSNRNKTLLITGDTVALARLIAGSLP